MRTCRFCGVELSGGKAGNESREHVFPQWLQARLGVVNSPYVSSKVNVPLGVSDDRYHSLSTMVAKSICRTCNSGWMSSLEMQVAPVLESMFTGKTASCFLISTDQEVLRQWCFKTTLAVLASIRLRDADVPIAHFRDMATAQHVPENVHVIASHTQGYHPPGIYTPEFITQYALRAGELNGYYSVVLSFGNLLIAVIYIPLPHCLALLAEFHASIGNQTVEYAWYLRENPEMVYEDQLDQWKDFVGCVVVFPEKPSLGTGWQDHTGKCGICNKPRVHARYRPTPISPPP